MSEHLRAEHEKDDGGRDVPLERAAAEEAELGHHPHRPRPLRARLDQRTKRIEHRGEAVPADVPAGAVHVVARREDELDREALDAHTALLAAFDTGEVNQHDVANGLKEKILPLWIAAEARLNAQRRALAENEVRLREAKLNQQRMRRLLEQGVSTQAQVDAADAEVDSIAARLDLGRQEVTVAEREVALRRQDVEDTVIRAPFAGVAVSKDAQPGEMISPVSAGGGFTRTGIGTVVDMSSLEIEVDVSESYIQRVGPGQEVEAVLDAYPEWVIPARVIAIVPTADRQKATVLVRIGFLELGDPRLLPDMGVKVTFLREADDTAAPAAQPVTLIPKGAVRSDGDRNYVFVIRQDTVERRAVQTGGSDGDRLEVLAGLSTSDRIVASPPPELADGMRIVVKQ